MTARAFWIPTLVVCLGLNVGVIAMPGDTPLMNYVGLALCSLALGLWWKDPSGLDRG